MGLFSSLFILVVCVQKPKCNHQLITLLSFTTDPRLSLHRCSVSNTIDITKTGRLKVYEKQNT